MSETIALVRRAAEDALVRQMPVPDDMTAWAEKYVEQSFKVPLLRSVVDHSGI